MPSSLMRALSRSVIAVAILATAVVLGPGRAWAPTAVEMRFGLVGLIADQTARINVVSFLPEGSCRVDLGFVNAQGLPLTDTMQTMLSPGQGAWLDLVGDGVVREGRLPIRPTVRLFPPDPCSRRVVATLELFDTATGKATIVVIPATLIREGGSMGEN